MFSRHNMYVSSQVYVKLAGGQVAVLADLRIQSEWSEDCVAKLTRILDELQVSYSHICCCCFLLLLVCCLFTAQPFTCRVTVRELWNCHFSLSHSPLSQFLPLYISFYIRPHGGQRQAWGWGWGALEVMGIENLCCFISIAGG